MTELLLEFEDRIDAPHCAILIVDIQNDFCHPDGYIGHKFGIDEDANKALAARNQALADAGRAAGAAIVWIRAIYDPHYLPPSMLVKGGSAGNEPRCFENTWGAELYEVTPADGDIHIEKHRYSAFSGTKLDSLLRHRGIRSTVITGVTTNICVESTLRDAFNLGYHVVVPEDCVAANDAELHAATLKNVSTMLGDVTTADALIERWR